MSSLLQRNGMSLDDLRLMSMAPLPCRVPIVRGDVDAVSVFHPFRIGAIDALGKNAVVLTDSQAYTAHALLAASADFLKERPEDARRVLTALIQAAEFSSANPEETLELLTKELDLTPDAMRRIRDDFVLDVVFEKESPVAR